MVNEDGAIKEWMSDEFEDNYFHRHLSHIYPLFPGSEISESDPLIKNFEKAVDMRVLQGQSGWSLMHIAGIYTCLARAEDAIKCIDILCKGCLLNNMMSMHNDYRDMGVTLDLGQFAPIQLDADMGAVNVIQLMIFSEKNGCLNILPSLPKRLKKGMVKNFAFYGGSVNITWDASMLEVRIFAKEKIKTKIKLPEGQYMIKSETEESRYSADKEYILEKDHILTICGNRSES